MPKMLIYDPFSQPERVETVDVLETALHNLNAARISADHDQNGLVVGYDNLMGRLNQAESVVVDYPGFSFPELHWAIREARYFLGDVPE